MQTVLLVVRLVFGALSLLAAMVIAAYGVYVLCRGSLNTDRTR